MKTDVTTLVDRSPGPSLTRLSRRLAPGVVVASAFTLESFVARSNVDFTWNVRGADGAPPLALRITPSDAAHAEAMLSQYRREVWLGRSIAHPRLAHAHTTGFDDGMYFVSQQRIDGTPVADALRARGSFTPEEVSRVGAALAEVLDAIHGAGAIHAALNPQCVLLTDDGAAALRSAGTALPLNQAARGGQHPVGLSRHLSPEQILGVACDVQVDVYALGLLLFEMLSGREAFADVSPVVSSARRLREDPPSLASLVDAPAGLCAVIERCLARDPARRFESALELAAALSSHQAVAHRPRAPRAAPAHVRIGGFASVTPSLQSTAEAIPEALAAVLRGAHGMHVRVGDSAHARWVGGQQVFSLTGVVSGEASETHVETELRDATSGAIRWRERFVLSIAPDDDPGSVVWRIAEPVRVTVQCLSAARELSSRSLERYGLARRLVREGNLSDPDDALVLLDEVLREAPGFGPAHGLRAMACVRGWSIVRAIPARRDWFAEAQVSLAECQKYCPDAPETWFARAHLAAQLGSYHEAVTAIRQALTRAPTMPEAHQVLGSLQLEAGRSQLGLERLALARVLDPYLPRAILEEARWNGLYGDPAVAEERLDALSRLPQTEHMVGHLRARAGVWRGDTPQVRAAVQTLQQGSRIVAPLMIAWAQTALGDLSLDDGLRAFEEAMEASSTPKVRSQFRQLCCELLCVRGDPARAMSALIECAASTLVDLEWIDWCPLLDILRARPEFARCRGLVAARSAEIWQL